MKNFEKDRISLKNTDIEITFIGHGTLMLEHRGKVIHVDPWEELADYSELPQGDIILVTHEHPDHLDPGALKKALKEKSQLICTRECIRKIEKIFPAPQIMGNGDSLEIEGIKIQAVPAYNLKLPFHKKGKGNGYILTLETLRVYIAGDTENTPEMKALKDIDIAFLPMNLPYTMTPAKVADGAKAFGPKILYPYHFGKTDTSKLTELLKDSDIDLRIRNME